MGSYDFEALVAAWWRSAAGAAALEDAIRADPRGCVLFLAAVAESEVEWYRPAALTVAEEARPTLLTLAAQDDALLALVADWLGVETAVEAIGAEEFGRRYVLLEHPEGYTPTWLDLTGFLGEGLQPAVYSAAIEAMVEVADDGGLDAIGDGPLDHLAGMDLALATALVHRHRSDPRWNRLLELKDEECRLHDCDPADFWCRQRPPS
ncbi:MAG: hypothetical protein R2694_12850 [Ilumatobacteraceae bacterium]